MTFFQYGIHCFCGNEIKTSSNRVLDVECDMSCYGNKEEYCGGYWRIYIFTNEQTVHLCKMEIGEYTTLHISRQCIYVKCNAPLKHILFGKENKHKVCLQTKCFTRQSISRYFDISMTPSNQLLKFKRNALLK